MWEVTAAVWSGCGPCDNARKSSRPEGRSHSASLGPDLAHHAREIAAEDLRDPRVRMSALRQERTDRLEAPHMVEIGNERVEIRRASLREDVVVDQALHELAVGLFVLRRARHRRDRVVAADADMVLARGIGGGR